jgi:hypothetical protein
MLQQLTNENVEDEELVNKFKIKRSIELKRR